MTLGERIRELRLEAPYIRQSDLAKRVGLSWPELSKIEADRIETDTLTVTKIAVALGANPNELLDLLSEWEPAPPLDLDGPGVIVCRRS